MAVTAPESRGEPKDGAIKQCRARDHRPLFRFALSPAGFAIVVLLSLFFLFLSDRLLWHTDLWGHLAYGRLIVANRALSVTEPLMPLSRGVRIVDLSWLSQVLGYLAFHWQGIAAIQFLYAVSITACLGLLARGIVRRTSWTWPALLATLACTWLEWHQFLIVRPQLAGLVCFVLLFVFLSRRRSGKEVWIVVPVLFVLWVNLHGSFVVGLGMLAAVAAGRAADLLYRTGKWKAVLRDARFRNLSLLILPAGLAALLNPYGWGVFQGVWETATNPNLADLVEWRPLDVQMRQGQAAAVVALALILLYRLTPRRVSSGELLLLLGLGAATLRSSRMIVWWAPVASWFLAVHAAAVWKRFRRPAAAETIAADRRVGPGWSLAAAVAVCGLAACSPLGMAVFCGVRAEPRQSLSRQTPLGATDYLNAHPPQGQIFNTYEWGDYLLWAGPKDLHVFVASHAHLVPSDVWQDYLRVIRLGSGWEKILDRYGVNLAVLDSDQHGELVDRLRESEDWSLVYEDDRSAIFARRHRDAPIGGQKKSSGPLQQ